MNEFDAYADDTVDRRARAAAARLVDSFDDDVDAALVAVRRGDATTTRTSHRRGWVAPIAAGLVVVAGTAALVAVAGDRGGDVEPIGTTPGTVSVTTQPATTLATSTTVAPSTTAVPSTTTSIPSTTTTPPAPTAGVASVSYLDPPPELTLRPLATLTVPDEASGGYDIAIGDRGVAVQQSFNNDYTRTQLDVIGFDGQVRRYPDLPYAGILAYGPGDVFYLTDQGHSIDEFAVVALGLGVDDWNEVARQPGDVNKFLEYPPMSFGHGTDGVIHRRSQLAGQPAVIGYSDVDGQPIRLDGAPPTFRFTDPFRDGEGLGGTIASSAGIAWELDVDAAPDRASPYVGASPPSPAPGGHGIYVTHIGPNANPDIDFGTATMWVLADLQPTGDASWWSIPDGWHVVASDTWGTILARRDGTQLDLALADIAP